MGAKRIELGFMVGLAPILALLIWTIVLVVGHLAGFAWITDMGIWSIAPVPILFLLTIACQGVPSPSGVDEQRAPMDSTSAGVPKSTNTFENIFLIGVFFVFLPCVLIGGSFAVLHMATTWSVALQLLLAIPIGILLTATALHG